VRDRTSGTWFWTRFPSVGQPCPSGDGNRTTVRDRTSGTWFWTWFATWRDA